MNVELKRLRYGLRWMFLLVTIVAVVVSIVPAYLRRARLTAVVEQLQAEGFEFEFHPEGRFELSRYFAALSAEPRVARRLSGNGRNTVALQRGFERDRLASLRRLEVFEDPWTPASKETLPVFARLTELRELRLGSGLTGTRNYQERREGLGSALSAWSCPKNLEHLDAGLYSNEIKDVLQFPSLKCVYFDSKRQHLVTSEDVKEIQRARFRAVTRGYVFAQGLRSDEIVSLMGMVESPEYFQAVDCDLFPSASAAIAAHEFFVLSLKECRISDAALARLDWNGETLTSLEDCEVSAERVAAHAASGSYQLSLRHNSKTGAHSVLVDTGYQGVMGHRVVSGPHAAEEFTREFFADFGRIKRLIVETPFALQILQQLDSESSPRELKIRCGVDQAFWDAFEGMPAVESLEIQHYFQSPIGSPRFTENHQLQQLRLYGTIETYEPFLAEIQKLSRLTLLEIDCSEEKVKLGDELIRALTNLGFQRKTKNGGSFYRNAGE